MNSGLVSDLLAVLCKKKVLDRNNFNQKFIKGKYISKLFTGSNNKLRFNEFGRIFELCNQIVMTEKESDFMKILQN